MKTLGSDVFQRVYAYYERRPSRRHVGPRAPTSVRPPPWTGHSLEAVCRTASLSSKGEAPDPALLELLNHDESKLPWCQMANDLVVFNSRQATPHPAPGMAPTPS